MIYFLVILTVALADLLVSALLVALTVTFDGEGTIFGALYSPPVLTVPNVEFPPVTPFTFHVTEVFVVLVTLAVNCLVAVTRTLALVGEMVTAIGSAFTTVTAALPATAGVTALLLA
jgi:hypothetical protein